MKTDHTIMIRYTGSDQARRFVLQRGDYTFWTGDGWDKRLGRARVFAHHKAAQKACAALQYRQYKGKPVRTFTVEMAITLVADDVEAVNLGVLASYLSYAMRIDMENSIHGDGPVAGSFVKAQVRLKTLKETKPRRRVF
jgi:hypothetical protein